MHKRLFIVLFLLFWSPSYEQWLVRVARWRSTCKPYKLVYSLHWFITFLGVKSMGLKKKHEGEILFPEQLFHPPCPAEMVEVVWGASAYTSWCPPPRRRGWPGWGIAPTHQWSTFPLVPSLSCFISIHDRVQRAIKTDNFFVCLPPTPPRNSEMMITWWVYEIIFERLGKVHYSMVQKQISFPI